MEGEGLEGVGLEVLLFVWLWSSGLMGEKVVDEVCNAAVVVVVALRDTSPFDNEPLLCDAVDGIKLYKSLSSSSSSSSQSSNIFPMSCWCW